MSQSSKERRSRVTAAPQRKPARSRGARFVRRLRDRWERLLAVDSFWVVLFLALATWALMPRVGWLPNDVEVGGIAGRDFVAPRDALVPDADTTEEKRHRAREEILPVYDFDPGAAQRFAHQLDRAFALGREALGPEGEASEPVDPQLLRVRLEDASTLRLTTEQVQLFMRRGFSRELQVRLSSAAEQPLERGVVGGKATLLEHRPHGIHLRNLQTGQEKRQLELDHYLDFPDELQDHVAAELRGWGDIPASQRSVLLELLLTNINPNLHVNQSETLRRQQAAASAVEEVFTRVRQGQVIVRKGDQIGPHAAQLIGRLRADAGSTSRLLPALGIFLLLSLLVLVLWLGVRKERMAQTRRPTALGEVLLLLLISVLGAKLAHLLASGLAQLIGVPPFDSVSSYLFAVPFASLALITVLLYGRGLALLVALVFSLLVPVIVEEASWTMVLYAMAGSMAAILAVDHFQFKQRSVMVRAGGVVALVNVVSVLMLAAIAGGPEGGAQLALRMACAVAGGVLVSAVASFLVPVLESVYSVTTGIKLVELANTNLPLLRRLAFEAPGSFQHSLMVANLSKAGCEAIEADSVLAYTGALYHDIGKVFRPDYYVENQRPGFNRHDKLLPSMSTLILISHVKDGLELAREHHLPEPIQDAIEQHHGTRLITYFYSRAKELHGTDSAAVSEEKFRYPGPKPQNKVMGVLMLADGVEAASRSLEDPSPAKLRTVVKAIVDDCLRDGQLDETDLTLGDLNQVSEAFLRVLSHIHHRRLDYPGFDFEGRQRAAKGGDSGELPAAQIPAAMERAPEPVDPSPSGEPTPAGEMAPSEEVDSPDEVAARRA